MTRIVVGNRDGALALSQARMIVADLTSEWPDLNLVQKTVPTGTDGDTAALLSALTRNQLSIAVVNMERLPGKLPEGLTLAAVTRRLEARSTLLGKGYKDISELPAGARVGVPGVRDILFLKAIAPEVEAVPFEGGLDDNLKRLAQGDVNALIMPASVLIGLERRHVIEELLDAGLFPPASGQGSLGLVTRDDDDASIELAYTMQHRPSLDRVRAERSFAVALEDSGSNIMQQDDVHAISAFATVSSDGELTLFGAVVAANGMMLQATTSGDASEAEDLGRELATDFTAQLAAL